MVPAPPSPSRISTLLMACGRILGMRVSASSTAALNILAAGIFEVISVVHSITPISGNRKKKTGQGREIDED